MKLKAIRWIALILGSISCIFVIGLVIFGGAYFIEGIKVGNLEPLNETFKEFLSLFVLILYVVSVAIAWFKQKIGGLLITIFALAQFALINEAELIWLQVSLLPIGPMLLFYVYYNKRQLKKD